VEDRVRSRPLFALPLLFALVLLPHCRRTPEPDEALPATRIDTTRVARQRIVHLEKVRSFGDGFLQESATSHDARVRRAAAMALGRIQDARAIETLLPLLEDPEPDVVEQTAWALRQLQGLDDSQRHAVQSALTLRLELEPQSRLWLFVDALGPHADAAAVEPIGKWVAAGLLAGMGSQAREPRLEGTAALALGQIESARSIKVMRAMGTLTNRDAPAAWRIAEAMTVRPDSSFLPALLSLTEHSHPYARAAGARALEKYADAAAVPALLRLLADLDWEVRAAALRALGAIDDADARSYCLAMCEDAHPLVRESALTALASIGIAARDEIVRQALGDRVAAVRLAALRALAANPDAEARAAFERLRSDPVDFVRSDVLGTAHAALGAETATPLLLQALASDSVRERSQAAQALAALGEALPGAQRDTVRVALETALQDSDFVVATLAAEALGELEMHESVPALVDAYRRWQRSHHDVDVRLAAVPAVAALASKVPREETLRFFSTACSDPDLRVVHEAERALANLRSEPEPPPPPPRARAMQPFPDPLPEIDLGRVRVRLITARGEAILELHGDDYPRTVGNFLRLVDSGFYDDGVFHRVVPAFVVQGGCPRGDGWGDAGTFLPCEYGNLRFDREGIVGMAHAGKDTGGSQFFITHLPVPRLDGRYTAFGRVVEGMEVVDRIVRGDAFRLERVTPEATP
jgi:cyclophilin family peptidyl-prolyl cis-trans isomerase/HEAT repeat protein